MRTAFIRSLIELARSDERLWLLVGDLGYSVVEPFAEEFPDRFINVGVAEQNMIGGATGLALSGKVVFCYSIANFPTLRCLEQIRNDVCHHKADVKIVSVGGGLAYGPLGMTHHATEDLAVMRSLPNMRVVAPGDPAEATLATRVAAATPGPFYLRLGRAGEPQVHETLPEFQLGKAIMVKEGRDGTLIATGGMLLTTLQAAQHLEPQGISLRVLSMHTVKPIDADAVWQAAEQTRAIFTVEEHSLIGGLGSAVAEVLAEGDSSRPLFRRLALADSFQDVVGSHSYLRELNGLSVEGISKAVRTLLGLCSER